VDHRGVVTVGFSEIRYGFFLSKVKPPAIDQHGEANFQPMVVIAVVACL